LECLSRTEQELKKHLEEQLDRFLTEKEINFISWIAEKMSLQDQVED
jgi:hypothetical protein